MRGLHLLRALRYILLALIALAGAGLILPLVLNTRAKSDRVACENHLREIGLIGVRNATIPGAGLPVQPRDELPPGTFLNTSLTPEKRMSWYVYLLSAINQGTANPNGQFKHRSPAGLEDRLRTYDPLGAWDCELNRDLAAYRLTVAICPATAKEASAATNTSSYLAVGGIGLDTPKLTPEEAGRFAGAYRYDGPTPDAWITDGQRETAQIIETNLNLSPWLQGGPGTLRGLEPELSPYIGKQRPFGGCHPGGCYASMVDGSVRFLKDTIEPEVFRALFTRAGGPEELKYDGP
jgi:Protein of unknown function (DUF1559)